MRNIGRILGATTLIGAITSAHLWQELSVSREVARNLQEQLTTMEARQRRTLPPAGIDQESREFQSMPASDARVAGAQMPTGRVAPDGAANGERTNVISSMELARDPVTRKAMAAGIRAALPLRYPYLAEELNLTDEQTRKLHDQLIENQLEMLGVGPAPGADAEARNEATRRREELTRSHEAALASMLGATSFSQWKDYQDTQGIHVQVGQLDTVLASTAQPLSAVQRRQMTAALASDQRASQPAILVAAGDRTPTLEELLQREEQQSRRLREVAASHLSREQFDAFEKMHSQASALSRAMLAAQRPTGTD